MKTTSGITKIYSHKICSTHQGNLKLPDALLSLANLNYFITRLCAFSSMFTMPKDMTNFLLAPQEVFNRPNSFSTADDTMLS